MFELDNDSARRLWLERQAMIGGPAGDAGHAALGGTVERLGMVQLDPLATVARAHHHILWSRHSPYRPRHFDTLLERRRRVFEHFTHDAAILPMTLWPWWERARRRQAGRYARRHRGQRLPDAREREAIVERIAREGALSSRDFECRADRSRHAWTRPPHKLALEYLWLAGRLAVSHRRGFVKHYDLVERVVPEALRETRLDEELQTDRLCRMALERLGVATAGELQRFWASCTRDEVERWLGRNARELTAASVVGADGCPRRAFAFADLEARAAALPRASSRVRVVSPFDPLVRDRARLARLFGFDYRIEIYVPPTRRRYGYYVYPVLEGTRFIGRVELRAEREQDRLRVLGWWPEPGLRLGSGRRERIERELVRLARLGGVAAVDPLPAPAVATL